MAPQVSPTMRVRAAMDERFAPDQDLARTSDAARSASSCKGWRPPPAVKTTMGPVKLQRLELGDEAATTVPSRLACGCGPASSSPAGSPAWGRKVP